MGLRNKSPKEKTNSIIKGPLWLQCVKKDRWVIEVTRGGKSDTGIKEFKLYRKKGHLSPWNKKKGEGPLRKKLRAGTNLWGRGGGCG